MTYFLLEHNPGRITFNNLTWKYHIDAITAKISKTIGLISKLRHSIPGHTLLYIYQTLIHPHLNYGLQGAKKIIFTACLSGKLKLEFTSPDIISNSPKPFSRAELISQFFCYSNSSKSITCPSGKLKTEFTCPIAKPTSPGLSDTTFFARWSCCLGSGIQDFPSCFGVKLWNEIPCHIRDLPKKKFTKVLHRLLSDILKEEMTILRHH